MCLGVHYTIRLREHEFLHYTIWLREHVFLHYTICLREHVFLHYTIWLCEHVFLHYTIGLREHVFLHYTIGLHDYVFLHYTIWLHKHVLLQLYDSFCCMALSVFSTLCREVKLLKSLYEFPLLLLYPASYKQIYPIFLQTYLQTKSTREERQEHHTNIKLLVLKAFINQIIKSIDQSDKTKSKQRCTVLAH